MGINRPNIPSTEQEQLRYNLRKFLQEYIDKKCGDKVSPKEKADLVMQLENDLAANSTRMRLFMSQDPKEREKTLTNIILVCQNPKLKNVKDRLLDFLVVDEKQRPELSPVVAAILKDKLMLAPKPGANNNKDEKENDRHEIKNGLVKKINNKECKGNDQLEGVLVEITENGHPELAGMMIGGKFIPLAITGISSARDVEEAPGVTKEHTSPSPFKTTPTPPWANGNS